MADLPNTVATDFAWYYEFVAAHVHKWVDPLTQEQCGAAYSLKQRTDAES